MGLKSRAFRQSIRRRGLVPSGLPKPERVDWTEAEKVRRDNRAWLRDRDESNAIDFEEDETWKA